MNMTTEYDNCSYCTVHTNYSTSSALGFTHASACIIDFPIIITNFKLQLSNT